MFKIVENTEVGPDIYYLALKYEQLEQKPVPGQFFNLKVSQNNCDDPLLRRPLSIFDYKEKKKRVEFIYKVIGKGTKILASMEEGKKLDVLGPLGSGFNLSRNKNLDLIGGGMGIAPLFYLAKKLKDENISIYLGASNKAELEFFESKFKKLDIDIHLAAIKEKLEIQGTALDLWLNYADRNNPDFVYTCGPEKMMVAVENECLKKDIGGELSVEKRMGCGIGVCLSCSCKTKNEKEKNKRACVEGPVFELGEVILDD